MKNLLLVLTDQEMYFPNNLSPDLKEYINNIPGYNKIRENGVVFHNHYIASTACSPSRTSLFYGHYPSLHQVTNTYGIDKKASQVNFMHPESLPSLGHYFKNIGYDTYYTGKFHQAQVDLLNEDGTILQTINKDGTRNKEAEKLYRKKNLLEPFGFSNWIGAEPHGTEPIHAGCCMDKIYKERIIELLEELENKDSDKPFLIVLSLINPHDIMLEIVLPIYGYNFDLDNVPYIEDSPTEFIDHEKNNKPICQQDFINKMPDILSTVTDKQKYKKLYYYLIRKVYVEINEVIEKLLNSKFKDNTVICLTSDHGHGGMIQNGYDHKWFSAYNQVIKSPFIISNLKDDNGNLITGNVNKLLTSHVDLLPTLVNLVTNKDYHDIFKNIKNKFINSKLPIGNDLSKIILNNNLENDLNYCYNTKVLFTTNDDISNGPNNIIFLGKFLPFLNKIFDTRYESVIGPTSIKTVVTYYDTKLYKFSKYYDENYNYKNDYEIYNLTDDPDESMNIRDEVNKQTFNDLENILESECMNKLLVPEIEIHSKSQEHKEKEISMILRLIFVFLIFKNIGFIKETKFLFNRRLNKNFKHYCLIIITLIFVFLILLASNSGSRLFASILFLIYMFLVKHIYNNY